MYIKANPASSLRPNILRFNEFVLRLYISLHFTSHRYMTHGTDLKQISCQSNPFTADITGP